MKEGGKVEEGKRRYDIFSVHSYSKKEKKLTSIFFNTSSVLVSEVSLPVSFVFLEFGPAEVKPLITHFSLTATVYCISLPFNMLSRIMICHTRQSHHLHIELIFLKNEQNKSAHLNNFPWDVNNNHLIRYFLRMQTDIFIQVLKICTGD